MASMNALDRPSVIVVGGGFAGFFAARILERLLPPDAADLTLMSATDHLGTARYRRGRVGPARARRIAVPCPTGHGTPRREHREPSDGCSLRSAGREPALRLSRRSRPRPSALVCLRHDHSEGRGTVADRSTLAAPRAADPTGVGPDSDAVDVDLVPRGGTQW